MSVDFRCNLFRKSLRDAQLRWGFLKGLLVCFLFFVGTLRQETVF